jgi:hypothetical protein
LVLHLDYRPTYSAKNLHQLSLRELSLHVRPVLFGKLSLDVRDARPLVLSFRHLLLEVLLVLRRLLF